MLARYAQVQNSSSSGPTMTSNIGVLLVLDAEFHLQLLHDFLSTLGQQPVARLDDDRTRRDEERFGVLTEEFGVGGLQVKRQPLEHGPMSGEPREREEVLLLERIEAVGADPLLPKKASNVLLRQLGNAR